MTCCERLLRFFKNSNTPILFAGAGVSMKAGLPTWHALLSQLAEATRPYDQLTRHIMMERIKENELLDAASYYYLCKKIPEAEKYSLIRKQFDIYSAENIKCLASLPFSAIITTNYDKALADSYVSFKGESPISFSLGDPALKAASFENEFYIARIHGRSEYPDSIVLSGEHYNELKSNDAYNNLLTYIFTRKQILFVGFSFLDPAIKSILETIKKHYGKEHKGRHLALLPDTADAKFVSELELFTIEKLYYSEKDDHVELWECLSELEQRLKQQDLDLDKSKIDPFSPAKKYLASCYARVKIGSKITPLKKSIAEGIVSTLIARAENQGTTKEEIIESVHMELSITKDESKDLTENAIAALTNDGLCQINNGKLTWVGNSVSVYDDAINVLSEGVMNRLIVREGGEETDSKLSCVKSVLKNLVLVRGWDLGAAFASNRIPEAFELDSIFKGVVECKDKDLCDDLSRSLYNLISAPSEKEAKLLTELGRMAFALELILQAPHSSVFHALTLPEKIYLDANVLMPAVTFGHPFHNVYHKTITSLLETAVNSHISIKVFAYHGFLNEVVSHRRLAKDAFLEQSFDKDSHAELINQAELFGVQNLNVFVGGYVSLLLNKYDISFEEYLAKYAPYDDEKSLANWLGESGISILYEHEINKPENMYPEILHSLEQAYSSNHSWKAKDAVLIKHDAYQMAALNSDLIKGVRSIFVTADRRLRENIEKGKFNALANNMVSHIGLMQLIDLLIGAEFDDQNISRLLWGSQISNETEQIRNYLIDHALNEYDDAIAMAMHDVVDNLTDEIVNNLKEEDLSLQSGSCADKNKIIKVIGSFENKYFTEMRKLIEKNQE